MTRMSEELERWGVSWIGPKEPICQVMPDGYWTPWHIADAALKAERQENADWKRKYSDLDAFCKSWASKAEAAEVRVVELEQIIRTDPDYAPWAKLEAAEARIEACRELPRFNVENGDPQMGGGYGPYRIKAVPKSRWIDDGMFVRVSELMEALAAVSSRL